MQAPQDSTAPPIESQVSSARDEQHRLMAEYVCGVYNSNNAKMYTKDMFLDLEAELAKDPLPDFVMMRSMSGIERRIKIFPKEEESFTPDLRIIQMLVHNAEQGRFLGDRGDGEDFKDENVKKAQATQPIKVNFWVHRNLAPSSPPPDIGEKFRAAWNAARRAWLQSDACSELIAILRDQARVPQTVQRVLCFGLESMEEWFKSDEPAWRKTHVSPATQHAAALTVAAVLGKRRAGGGGSPLPVIAQDPAYEAAELRLLAAEGIEVVGGRRGLAGFALVDDNCFVISSRPNVPVKQIVADLAHPAGMMWNRVTAPEEERTQWEVAVIDGEEVNMAPWSPDEDSPRTRTLVEGYQQYDFPAGHEHFPGIKFYIRKDKD